MKTLKMKTIFFYAVLCCTFFVSPLSAQTQDPLSIYRAEREASLDLVHTKLAVAFDFEAKEMAGEAWITLSPQF